MRIYFDNGATSYPKPEIVAQTISNYITNIGCSVGRGIYKEATLSEDVVYETREMLSQLVNYHHPENVCFTKNITESLNVIIKGLINPKDKVLVSPVEHNAVMRPLNAVDAEIIKVDVLKNLSSFEEELKKEIKAVIMTHSSNVTGDILPIKEIGNLCKKYSIPFILDAAQSAGMLDIDMEDMNIDVLCFTGHKSLLGPQGIGGFIIKSPMVPKIKSFIQGGTGSKSDVEVQPDFMPDKYESGTPNMLGIFGLNASLKYLKDVGIPEVYKKEQQLMKYFYDNLSKLTEKNINYRLLGVNDISNRTPVFSLDFTGFDNAMISYELQAKYNIQNRCGLHCSPSAHKYYDSFPQGSVRLSFGYMNTQEEIDYCIKAIMDIF
ncbi:MAG: aminotransferase class V-fold PLP-dependent enzyme [Filifactoraceae bacterium]